LTVPGLTPTVSEFLSMLASLFIKAETTSLSPPFLSPMIPDACDLGTLKNQTYDNLPEAALTTGDKADNYTLSYLPGQRLSACTCKSDITRSYRLLFPLHDRRVWFPDPTPTFLDHLQILDLDERMARSVSLKLQPFFFLCSRHLISVPPADQPLSLLILLVGRGAPEIDIFEAQVDADTETGHNSMSGQWAPFGSSIFCYPFLLPPLRPASSFSSKTGS
jgi:hypothetical protein